jgi:hypothetical protein
MLSLFAKKFTLFPIKILIYEDGRDEREYSDAMSKNLPILVIVILKESNYIFTLYNYNIKQIEE